MRIQYLGKVARTKTIAGVDCVFEPDGTGRFVCDVKDKAAQTVLLDPRNANLFRSLEAAPALKRGTPPPVEPDGKGDDALPPSPNVAAAAALLDNDAATVIAMLDDISDQALLDELRTQESARKGGPRKTVMAKLGG